MREDHEDLTAQREAVATAYADLSHALEALVGVASTAAKASRRKTPCPDLDAVRAAITAVDRAETAVDTARYDLHTASGGDG